MKIGFLGLKEAFDYYNIGGTESFIRRISLYLLERGNSVDYILFGNTEDNIINQNPEFTLKYYKFFKDALIDIKKGEYDHIVNVYIPIYKKINFAFIRQAKKSTLFHFIYFNYPDLLIKRYFYFNESRLFPYSGKLFCISKRQYDYVSKWAKNAVYILPPVPDSYFLKPEEKPDNKRIKVTFLGRIDPGKGIEEVIEIFKALKNNNKFECSIYGIHIPEDKESLEIHNFLKSQKEIKYIEVERKKYSPEIEEMTRNIFKNTDILILPYKKLSSTIDTPLILLEAMASLCVIITKPFGNIPDIYGKSKFLISPEKFVYECIELLKSITYEDLIEERNRIYEQNRILDFKTSSVSQKFLDSLYSL